MFDFFDSIHQRCMDASGVSDSMPFAPDKILSTLLFACSQKSAASVFSDEVKRLGMHWLSLFYDAFSESIRRRVGFEAEKRLTTAYAEAASKFRQNLSLKQVLSEQDIQSVLRDCALLVERPIEPLVIAAQLNAEINDYIATKGEDLSPQLVSKNQMGRFLRLFPHDVYLVLKQAMSRKPENSPSFWLQQLYIDQSAVIDTARSSR